MKLKKWEIALAIILIVVIFTTSTACALSAQQTELSNKLIRLHVIANSDSETDQNMKLFVRDAVTAELNPLLEAADSRDSAAEIITNNIDRIESIASNAVKMFGGEYSVRVTLGKENYPTREYDTFSLPAGEYVSLKVVIGGGAGRNWWCVVFPPVCFSAATKDDLSEMNFSNGEIEFITGQDNGYAFRFKLLEQIESVKQFFKNLV